ncbi:nucleosome assembly protein 1;4-like [Lycium ferocissimum]|uniref:nucleosome assembly protein 1;4-like n=1 Tax=Lycium ferocissimum TaxID=112874 RepID=UPI002814AAEA|nr:nucleosome assembly protein 1;4-like [Lycium ferocissimum]
MMSLKRSFWRRKAALEAKYQQLYEPLNTEGVNEAPMNMDEDKKTENAKVFIGYFLSSVHIDWSSVLNKTYHMIGDDEHIPEVLGLTEWHPGKGLAQKIIKGKPKKGSKNAKPLIRTDTRKSFFCISNPPEVCEDDDDNDEDVAEAFGRDEFEDSEEDEDEQEDDKEEDEDE